ncbi:MAG: hypothetical protein B6D68_01770 [spirochete symbiont of Stewartia floridana]|nr:MAG: hypothetical protein B6D68_01770 [spirochete symbiont of Stewartia floridana]
MGEWDAETAEWYAKTYGEYATCRLAVDAMEIAPDAVIVDVGCGTGAALRHVACRVPDGTLIGTDPTPRMVEIARERAASHPEGARIDFREGPAEKLPVDDASADIVLAFDSIDHWQNQERGLAEIRRVLKPGGQLAVVKDDGVSGGAEARRAFLDGLAASGFDVTSERAIEGEDVSFTMWLCAEGLD